MAKLDKLPQAASSGWIAGRRDERDFTLLPRTPQAERVLYSLDRRVKEPAVPPEHFLPVEYFGEVLNQGSLNACTAYAGVALMEYRVRRDRGGEPKCSPGFLYKVTRDLMKKDGHPNTAGNVPTDSRTTMKAMTMVGVAAEKVFATSEDNLDRDPDALTYALAANYKATSYWRVDVGDMRGDDLLTEVKRMLHLDLPLMFTVRFFVQRSLQDFARETNREGYEFPLPREEHIQALKTREAVEKLLVPGSEGVLASAAPGVAPVDPQVRAQAAMLEVQKALGLKPGKGAGERPIASAAAPAPAPVGSFVGHSLVACGFDDKRERLLVRNSWSDEWAPIRGLPGYGYLPYDFVRKGLTEDWWFITDVSFVDPNVFGATPPASAA
jgi:hypothetical protein